MVIKPVGFIVTYPLDFNFILDAKEDEACLFDMEGKAVERDGYHFDGKINQILKITKIIRQLNPVD